MATPPTASDSRVRFQSLKKEIGLLFLAAFYFLIATNTQSGWLLLMSAFLLGLLLMSWLGPRRSIQGVRVQQRILNQAQLGRPLNVEFKLSNLTDGKIKEILIKTPVQSWSESPGFRWLDPLLFAQGRSTGLYTLVPNRRGEHRIEGAHIVCGAPFGLFTVLRAIDPAPPFLVYPKLESLPKDHGKSRLAGLLSQISAPRSRGESRSIRSLREYRAGDDLRRVHWKSSSKLAGTGANLLVCEYLAPAKKARTLVLDTSQRPDSDDPLFEKSVSLLASVLWAAHRSGTSNTLLLINPEGEWEKSSRWRDQYRMLARVQQAPELTFQAWSASLSQSAYQIELSATPILVTSAGAELKSETIDWASSILLMTDKTRQESPLSSSRVTCVDAEKPGFQEMLNLV